MLARVGAALFAAKFGTHKRENCKGVPQLVSHKVPDDTTRLTLNFGNDVGGTKDRDSAAAQRRGCKDVSQNIFPGTSRDLRMRQRELFQSFSEKGDLAGLWSCASVLQLDPCRDIDCQFHHVETEPVSFEHLHQPVVRYLHQIANLPPECSIPAHPTREIKRLHRPTGSWPSQWQRHETRRWRGHQTPASPRPKQAPEERHVSLCIPGSQVAEEALTTPSSMENA